MGQGALSSAHDTRQLSVPFRFTVSAKQTINEERLERLIVMRTAGKLDNSRSLDQCITCVTRNFTQNNLARLWAYTFPELLRIGQHKEFHDRSLNNTQSIVQGSYLSVCGLLLMFTKSTLPNDRADHLSRWDGKSWQMLGLVLQT